MSSTDSPGGDSAPWRAKASRSRLWVVWAFVGVAAVAGGAVLFLRQPSLPAPASAGASQDADFDEPVAPDPGYVGPQACAACHAARVAEFQATRHFRASCLPQAEAMPPGFAPGKATYATHDPGLRFEMTQAGDDFFQTAIRTTPTGEQRTAARIALVYGAGGMADEVYFTWHDDRLYELPLAWLHPQKRWGMAGYNPYGTGDFSREATTRCLECHSTWFEHVAGTRNQYQRHNSILGVTCERCHGPGREHVAFHQAHPEARTAQAVVHPGRLSRDRQLDLCGQCHSNAIKPRGPPFRYRPGEPLEAYFRTLASKHPENDHVANQVKYLRQSQCFQKSAALTCTTCHNPHHATNPSAVRPACLKCHQPADCAEQNHLPAAVRGNCVGCHMPQRFKIQVSFDTEDDGYVPPVRSYEHRIAVYPRARQEVLLTWHHTQADALSCQQAARLTRELVGHWLAEADTCRREYRFLAAIAALREAVRLDPSPATRAPLRQAVATQAKLDADLVTAEHLLRKSQVKEAIGTLNEVLAIKPDWARAHGKLGTCYAIAGQRALAVEHLHSATRYDPDDPYGYLMLGWLAYLEGRAEEAVQAYREADAIEPFNAKTNYHLGLALAKLGRWLEAAECFRQVLTIDPNHAGGCQAFSHALRQQGRPAEALRYGVRAARLTRFQNPDILLTLAEAYAAAGRFVEASATAAQALEAAQVSDPKLVPQIRGRVEEMQAHAKQAPK